MLEIVILTIVIIVSFIAIAWFATQRTKKRNHDFMVDLAQRMEPELTGGDEFTSIFEEELKQHVNLNSDIDAEPAVTLSDTAQQTVKPLSVDMTKHVRTTPTQTEIDLTVGDDDDIELEVEQPQSKPSTEPASLEPNDSAVNDWDMVIAFTVMAQDDQKFVGGDLKAVLDNLNLSFGDMNIYHRLTAGSHKKPLFSIANIIEPGTFTPDNVGAMTTPGIVIFAKLPGPVNGLTLFDDVLETAQYLTEQLDGVLCDEARQPVTQNTLEAMRSRIFALNLSLQTEQN